MPTSDRPESTRSDSPRRVSAEEVLRAVAEDTAAATGRDFFRSLTRGLATALDLRYCFLTECLDSPATRVATLAFWNGSDFLDRFEYNLAGTPCENVMAGYACVYSQGVRELFPDDQDLVDLEAESYAAVPFQGADGKVIGHLAVLDVEVLEEDSLDVSVLKIFSARAGAELERQRAMAELKTSETLLERRVLDRTEELETFIHTVSHDLRSPLVTISGFVDLLGKDYEPRLDDRGKEYLSYISRGVESMGTLLDHLLFYSRLDRTDLELMPVALGAAVAEALDQLTADISKAGAGIDVRDDAVWVEANRTALVQSLTNLISNAVKYSREGETSQVRVWAVDCGTNVRVHVQDNGIGIAPEHQEKVFRVFQRVPGSDAYTGSGLGLPIVKKAVERMGGSVGLVSAPGVGSTFWIELRKTPAGSSPPTP